jgi:membrane peptidoglycan carboxypeptidase
MTNVGGISVFGASYPADIWKDYMEAALAKEPEVKFKLPDEKAWPRAQYIDEQDGRGKTSYYSNNYYSNSNSSTSTTPAIVPPETVTTVPRIVAPTTAPPDTVPHTTPKTTPPTVPPTSPPTPPATGP